MKKKKINWGSIAKKYDESVFKVVGNQTIDDIKNDILTINNTGICLDPACGTGLFTKEIYKNAKKLYCTDISENMLNNIKEIYPEKKDFIYKKENCKCTSFNDNKFDTIFLVNIMHISEEPEQILKECYRILKTEGNLIIISYTMENMPFFKKIFFIYRFLKEWGFKKNSGKEKFTLKYLKKILAKNNFKIKKNEIKNSHVNYIFSMSKK